MKLPLRRATWHSTTIEDAEGQAIAHTGSVEEADQFIKCVNTHDDLLAALQWFVENDDTNIGMAGNEFWEDGLNAGIAAIAKATKEIP